MVISFTAHSALAFSGALLADQKTTQWPPTELLNSSAAHNTPARTKARIRGTCGTRGTRHAVLVDANGLWAWNPHDAHAPATRYESLPNWVEKNPSSQMHVLVSSPLVRSVCHLAAKVVEDDEAARVRARRMLIETHGHIASSWPLAVWASTAARGVCALAGIDLSALRRHALRHDVELQAVEPWWHHAFAEAKRCVSALSTSERSHVCVVEGTQIAWITTAAGELAEVQQLRLAAPTVNSLHIKIQEMLLQAPALHAEGRIHTVVLGQGLTDGARTRALGTVVLGRLDGDQPPQWLRPSDRVEFH